MKIPKDGSKWSGTDGSVFHVMHTIKLKGKVWIYYHKDKPRENDPADYSCYLESFLERFRELPE